MGARRWRVAILGAGRVGTALGRLLAESGYAIAGVCRRDVSAASVACQWIGSGRPETDPVRAAADADLVLICTPDRMVRAMCERLAGAGLGRAGVVWVHTSGALPAAAMAVAGSEGVLHLALHPLQAVPDAVRGTERLRGAWYGIEGSPEALAVGRALVADLQGRAVEVPAEGKALYHAAASVVSNYLVVLMAVGLCLWQRAGLPREQGLAALVQLMRSALAGMEERGVPGALTGPIERGDVETVRRHLRALAEAAPETGVQGEAQGARLVELYAGLGLAAVELAREKGSLPEEVAAQLRAVLAEARHGGRVGSHEGEQGAGAPLEGDEAAGRENHRVDRL